MSYRLNIEEICKNFNFNKDSKIKLSHNTGNKIRILPYRANFKDIYISNFKSITGEFSRLLSNKKVNTDFCLDSLCDQVVEKVEINLKDRDVFKDLVRELFFNRDNELQSFHPIIFNYTPLQHPEHKKIASFLYNVLVNDGIKHSAFKMYDYKPRNIMLKLIIENLPGMHSSEKIDDENYINYLPFVQSVFAEDFKCLLTNHMLFVENFEGFLKYYYFYYVSQLSIKLNQMFNADLDRPEPLLFILESEKISKSRTCYTNGWKLLSGNINNLFSHASCLELLNHIDKDDKSKLSYVDIKNTVDLLSEEQKEYFISDLDKLLSLYKDHIPNIDWNNFNIVNRPYNDDSVLNKVYELLRTIEYQFANSVGDRKSANQKYCNWFEYFCRKHFLKSHGSLGFTLTINQDYLILITRLCMNNRERIGLKNLFYEYERRGLFFDSDSKEAVIQLFDKLNLLEKKSDSGDAQYVKAIL